MGAEYSSRQFLCTHWEEPALLPLSTFTFHTSTCPTSSTRNTWPGKGWYTCSAISGSSSTATNKPSGKSALPLPLTVVGDMRGDLGLGDLGLGDLALGDLALGDLVRGDQDFVELDICTQTILNEQTNKTASHYSTICMNIQ